MLTNEEREEYRRKLEAELATIGAKDFRRKHGNTPHAQDPYSLIEQAVIADLDRREADAQQLALIDQGAQRVGHAADANRIALHAMKYARDSRSIAVGALILSGIGILVAVFWP